jgi:hypothetical protein
LDVRLRAAADAKAAEEARLEAAAKVRAAEEARAMAEEEAKLRAEAESRAAGEARRAAAAKAKAEEEAKAKAEAEAKLNELAAKAVEESRLRTMAEAKAAEEAQLRAAAEARAMEQARLKAEAEAKAVEEAQLAAAAQAKADAEAMAKVEAEAKLRAAAEARAGEEARLRAEIEAKAAAESKAANEAAKVLHKKVKAAEEAIAKAEANARKEGRKSKGGKSARNVWFYTCEGDRLGPVTFEELRSMAAAASLDPRRDMVWKQGMDAWKPAGRIDGLFERRDVALESPEPSLQPAVSQPVSVTVRTPGVARSEGDSPWPGARRRSLLFALLIFPLVWQYALSAGGPFLTQRFGEVMMTRILPFAALVPLLVLIHFSLKRLVNLGMSRWWSLAVFVPVLNLWLGHRCLACPTGYAHHKKMDGAGIMLAIVYWLLVLAGAAILAIAIAPLLGAMEGLEIPGQLRGLIRRFSA